MHMQRTQPATGSIVYIYKLISTYLISSARLESRLFNHMKVVVPPPGIEPGPSTFWAGVQPLHHGDNLHREHICLYIYACHEPAPIFIAHFPISLTLWSQ